MLYSYSQYAVDTNGTIVPGADVEVRIFGTGAIASDLTDATGAAKSGTFTAGADGLVEFWGPSGVYLVTIGADPTDDTEPVTLGAAGDFKTVALLLADTAMKYTATGEYQHPVATGGGVTAGGYRYEVAASAATDYHLITTGGVKLYVLPLADGKYPADALGLLDATSAVAWSRLDLLSTHIETLGGGTISFGAGDYTVDKSFRMRDFVTYEGVGYNTHLINDGTTPDHAHSTKATGVLFGDMAPNAFDGVVGNILTSPARGDKTITFSTPADANRYAVGMMIVIWSANGYLTGLSELKPAYQQFNRIMALDTGTGVAELEHPIYRDGEAVMYAGIQGDLNSVAWTGPFWTVGAGLKNLSVSAADTDNWSRQGGAYQADIDIWVRNSNSILATNGLAYSRVHVRGSTQRKGMEMAVMCHFNHIRINGGVLTNALSDGFGIKFTEGAHNNYIDAPVFEASDSLTTDSAISFSQGSLNNTVQSPIITGDTCASLIVSANSYPNVPYGGNSVIDPKIHFKQVNVGITTGSHDGVADVGLTVIGGTLEADTVVQNSFAIRASGLHVLDTHCILKGKNCFIEDAVANNIVRASFDEKVTRSVKSSGAEPGVIWEGSHPESVKLQSARIDYGTGTASHSTDTNNIVARTGILANSLLGRDKIDFELFGLISGTAGAKTITLRIGGEVARSLVIPQAYTGAVHMAGALIALNNSGAVRAYSVETTDTSAAYRKVITVDPTADMEVELVVYVADAADGVTVEGFYLSCAAKQ